MRMPRILLVEDETALLRLMERYLGRRGYETLACERGDDAWKCFTEPESHFDLAIVDRILPDCDGEVLLDRILKADPKLQAIVCSGALDSGRFRNVDRVRYLQKPFLPRMLGEAVDAALRPKEAGQAS